MNTTLTESVSTLNVGLTDRKSGEVFQTVQVDVEIVQHPKIKSMTMQKVLRVMGLSDEQCVDIDKVNAHLASGFCTISTAIRGCLVSA